MKLREGLLSAVVAGGMLAAAAATAAAQTYPEKPILWIVPTSPGGGSDTVTRLVANALVPILGQRVVVENRAGASGNIGAQAAAKAAPDGYTWIMVGSAHTANVSMFKKLNYDLVKDFEPVTQVNAAPHVILVHPTLGAEKLADLVGLAKADPGKLDYASAGTGTVTFLAAEMFKAQADVDLTHVPYKGGGESLRSVIAGETSVYFAPLAVAIPVVQQGQARALAVTSRERVPSLPDVPTIAESGYPGFEFNLWNGVLVPAGTPKETIETIHGAIKKALALPEVQERMDAMGTIVVGSDPDDFRAFMKADIDSLGELVRKLNLQVD